jgi:hypothetical protein
MRFTIGLVVALCLQFPSLALAQNATGPTLAAVCIPPPGAKSCAELNCKGPCKEKWRGGQCLGGYCPQGIVATGARAVSPQKVTPLSKSDK